MMFCRYCGAAIADDSLFCAKCGRKLGHKVNPRIEKIVKVLHLRTPYPYAAFLILLAAVWAFMPEDKVRVDYSLLKWTLESERKLDLPAEKLFQQGFSLVLENDGPAAIRDIPVDFSATIEPPQPAEIEANLMGNKQMIMRSGKVLPLGVVLSDEVRPGKKRSFSVEGTIQATTPFKVTYEIREPDSEKILASYVVER
jgi:hypothetical protein